jgi:ubiquinone biosynthesis protein COQ9
MRDKIVDTALELAGTRSWEAVRLHDIADAMKITLDEVRVHFREKEDVVDAWFDRADRAMLGLRENAEFLSLTPKLRLHRLMMAWFGALSGHRRATRQMIYGKMEPGHIHIQIPGLLRVSRTVQWMREAAHRDATYLRRALEETGLTSIYLATFFYWMNDDSPGSSRTSELLSRLLGAAETLDHLVYGAWEKARTGSAWTRSPMP